MYFAYTDFSRANWSAAESECGSVQHMAMDKLGIGNKIYTWEFQFLFSYEDSTEKKFMCASLWQQKLGHLSVVTLPKFYSRS